MQSDGDGLGRYRDDLTFKTLRGFGAELKSGSVSQFGGIMLVNNNHWMAFSISPIESTIYLGDSLCPTGDVQSAAAKEAIMVLQWWLNASYSRSDRSFHIAWLPIAYQNDASSCGFFALDALMHHLIPTEHPLHTGNDTATLHVKLLMSILDCHSTQTVPALVPVTVVDPVEVTPEMTVRQSMASAITNPVPTIFPAAAANPATILAMMTSSNQVAPEMTIRQSMASVEAITMPTPTIFPVAAANLATMIPAMKTSSNQVAPEMMIGQSTALVEATMTPAMMMLPDQAAPMLPLADLGSNPNSGGLRGERKKLDLTFWEEDKGHGILKFFSRVSRKEFEQQTLMQFEKITERHEDAQMEEQLVSRVKAEKSRALARERQQRHRAKLAVVNGTEVGEKGLDGADTNASVPGMMKVRKFARATNWFQPIFWVVITEVAATVGWSMSPTEIVKGCQTRSQKLFQSLWADVVRKWIDRTGSRPCWSEETLAKVAKESCPGGNITRKGILASYPETIEAIKQTLLSIRQAGAALDAHQIRGVIIAQIQHSRPSILRTVVRKDGSIFAASMGWVRKFLKEEMKWSLRRATHASQKIPPNADDKIYSSLLRQAYSIRRYMIPDSLRVNSDQTQVIYQQNSTSTYEKKGSRQVSTVSHDEKHAFTLNVAISANGGLLPFQAIFRGKTPASLPSINAPNYDDTKRLGFLFEISGNDTYWANIGTMQSFVKTILVPYFNAEKGRLSLCWRNRVLWEAGRVFVQPHSHIRVRNSPGQPHSRGSVTT
ncbi:uncharacterized protein EI90DRAFT_3133107 [Cantharellus anzutake]|uniref:uncharacterized protein n=1 Tax=Cantharellus anzutake TaxID=1750568 RepID=UPI00190627D8|nr:uncharacterized protein EI90DRAFT_3133107 [Cantharellus anzutake]KAF8318611.1 hypothetical protein EI90DRAFT_3133107 [Cantharellus anzutake]